MIRRTEKRGDGAISKIIEVLMVHRATEVSVQSLDSFGNKCFVYKFSNKTLK